MAVTKKEIRDDIILRLTQGKPSSDFEVTNAQIDRWIDMARDRIVATYLFEAGRNDGHYVDPTYVKSIDGLSLSLVATTDEAELSATIPDPILSTPLNDYGLVRVRVKLTAGPYTHTVCQKVDRRTLEDLKLMEFGAPTPENPVAYREGQTIFVSGFTTDISGTHTLAVDFVEAMVGSSTDYSISEVHLAEVTELAEQIGLRELGQINIDPVNDGDQNSILMDITKNQGRR